MRQRNAHTRRHERATRSRVLIESWRDIMISLKQFSLLGAAASLVLGTVSVVMAQTAASGQPGSPMYDAKTETTITGTVDSVETVTGMRGGAPGGTHLVVKTDKEMLEIH